MLIDHPEEETQPDWLRDYLAPHGSPTQRVTVHWCRYAGGHRPTLGEMRNAAFDKTEAQLLIQWDDDDYHGPDRISAQVAAWRPGQAVVLKNQMRADLHGGDAFAYSRPAGIDGTIRQSRATAQR